MGAAAYLLDRLTKTWALHHLQGRKPLVLVPNVLQLRFTTNSGGAFSLLAGRPWLFFAATVVVCMVIVAVSLRLAWSMVAVSLGLILGGALGNLTDRIVRGTGISGSVVDFVDLHVWPVFNMADSAIVIGALLLGVWTLRRGDAG